MQQPQESLDSSNTPTNNQNPYPRTQSGQLPTLGLDNEANDQRNRRIYSQKRVKIAPTTPYNNLQNCDMTPTQGGEGAEMTLGKCEAMTPGVNGVRWGDEVVVVLNDFSPIEKIDSDMDNSFLKGDGIGGDASVTARRASGNQDGDRPIIKAMLEKVTRERKPQDIGKLWSYFKLNVASLVKKELPGYEVDLLDAEIDKKMLELKFKKDKGWFSCYVKEKSSWTNWEDQFVVYFPSAMEQKQMIKSRNRGPSKTDSHVFESPLPDMRKESGFLGRIVEAAEARNARRKRETLGPLGALLINPDYESVRNTIAGGRRSFDKINEHIEDFISKLPQDKDWNELREILRAKFFSIKGIKPSKVRLYLHKLATMVNNVDKVSTKIAEKKIEINFLEKPLYLTAREIATSETSILNYIRDVAWAPLTYCVVDIFSDAENTTFTTQTITQTVLSMLAMAIAAIFFHIIKNRYASTEDNGIDSKISIVPQDEPRFVVFLRTLFIWLGAGLAIPGWNVLQVVGVNTGLRLKMGSLGAGYFSSMFPGIPEGPIQGIMSIISVNTIYGLWSKFNIITFLEQLLIFATFGAVPGDIWQLAYQAITVSLESFDHLPMWALMIILGLGLASAVYAGNVAFGTGYERIINQSHLKIELDIIEDSFDMQPEDVVDHAHGHIVSYNGRPGAPIEEDIVVKQHGHVGSSRHYSHRSYSHRSYHSSRSRLSV